MAKHLAPASPYRPHRAYVLNVTTYENEATCYLQLLHAKSYNDYSWAADYRWSTRIPEPLGYGSMAYEGHSIATDLWRSLDLQVPAKPCLWVPRRGNPAEHLGIPLGGSSGERL